MVLFKDQNDVNVLLQLLEDIKSVSSAKVNWQKSEAIIVGSWLCGEPIHGYSQKCSWAKMPYAGHILSTHCLLKDPVFNLVYR